MKHLIATLLCAVTFATAFTACGGGSKEQAAPPAVVAEVEEQNTQLAEALSTGNLSVASEMADSMSVFVDDFTPEQTVQVLMAFLSVHNDAVKKKDRRRDLETLRKYVDVYDIALSANPKDTRAAFDKARKVNPAVNFDSLAASFREKLTQYDAIHDGSLVSDTPASDAVGTDSLASSSSSSTGNTAELPVQYRPAE